MKKFIAVFVLVCLLSSVFVLGAYADDGYINNQWDFENAVYAAVPGGAITLAAGDFTMPADTGGKMLIIIGTGAELTRISFPADYVENPAIIFVDVTVAERNTGSTPPEENQPPKMKLLAPMPKSGGTDVAQNTRTGETYSSIQEAVKEAESGDTIKVIASHDIDYSTGVKNSDDYFTLINVAEKAVTIDLNGKKIGVDNGALPDDAKNDMLLAVFAVDGGGNLTLGDSVGGGRVEVTANNKLVYSLAYCYADDAKMKIEGGSYFLDYGDVGRGLIYSNKSGNVEVTGGHFAVANTGELENGSPWIFNVSGKDTGYIYVTGGSFNADIINTKWAYEVMTRGDIALKETEPGKWEFVDALASANRTYYRSPDKDYETGYLTMEEAFKNANEPEEYVTLQSNLTLDKSVSADSEDDRIYIAAGKNLTINLNGNTINGNYAKGAFINIPQGATLTIIGEGTITNGTNSLEEIFAKDDLDRVKLSGGTWSFDPTDYIPDGAKVEHDEDNGTWRVIPPSKPVEKAPGAAPANPYEIPATADNSNMPLWTVLFVAFAAVALMTGKKKKA